METSPPVRDISERNNANRKRLIVIILISLVVVIGVLGAVAYFTLREGSFTPAVAASYVDKVVPNGSPENWTVPFCDGTTGVLLAHNGTPTFSRLGDCVLQVSNSTEPDAENHRNITCTINSSNITFLSLPLLQPLPISTIYSYNVTFELAFDICPGNKVQNITVRPIDTAEKQDRTNRRGIQLGVGQVVGTFFANKTLESLKNDYSNMEKVVVNEDLHEGPPNWANICKLFA